MHSLSINFSLTMTSLPTYVPFYSLFLHFFISVTHYQHHLYPITPITSTPRCRQLLLHVLRARLREQTDVSHSTSSSRTHRGVVGLADDESAQQNAYCRCVCVCVYICVNMCGWYILYLKEPVIPLDGWDMHAWLTWLWVLYHNAWSCSIIGWDMRD